MKEYKLIIFDKDGTICQSKTGKQFINSVDDQELIPGVLDKINELKQQGMKIAIASNQGGVAYGYMTIFEASAIIQHAASLIEADYHVFCPYHPEGTMKQFAIETASRKPGPGMIFEAAAMLGIDIEAVLYIGDRPEDEQAAKNAGVDFQWAKDFFGID